MAARFSIENPSIRVTILEEGGHVAEILDKASGVSPLWIPPWPSIEPSGYDRPSIPGTARIRRANCSAGIMGSQPLPGYFRRHLRREAAAGLTVHGEASIARLRRLKAGRTRRACARNFPLRSSPLSGRFAWRAAMSRFANRWKIFLQPTGPRPGPSTSRSVRRFWKRAHGISRLGHARQSDRERFQRRHGLHENRRRIRLAECAAHRQAATRTCGSYTATPSFGRIRFAVAGSPSRHRVLSRRFRPRRARWRFGYAWRRADFPWLGRGRKF